MTIQEAALSQEQQQAGLPVLAFGPFRLHRGPRMLCLGQEPVRLGGRALDLLVALAERAGDVVSRAELERQVWPHSLVEDSSLRVHVAALRKALGDGVGEARYIANVPGRGYSFVATIRLEAAGRPGPSGAPLLQAPAARPLPVRLTSIVGRDEAVTALCHDLPARRLATIVGHGGMGKTALALAVAGQLAPRYADGACFVDLAPLNDPALVPDALASALGIAGFVDSVIHTLDTWLRPRSMLLVVDNCEHLLDAATALIERVLRLAPGIDVLATSREPLDADGEWVHRLAPLASPSEGESLSRGEALAYPALRLLVERAEASADSFELGQADLAGAIALCRRLDGVPLAIEFAAARIGLLGVQGVLAQLDDRLRLLGSGRRTALPRHRTLRALLDWSYELLSPGQRRVLRCCGIFHGPFTLESAVAVMAGAAIDPAEVRDAVLALVAKSLIVAEPGARGPAFCLLEITRAYALDLLGADPEHAAIARRHARHMVELMGQCEADWENMPRADWRAAYQHLAGNVRSALDWAFGARGDPETGVRLSGAMMLHMARIVSEDELRATGRRGFDARDEMRLQTMLASVAGSGWGGAPARTAAPPSVPRGGANAEQGRRVDEQIEALFHLGARQFGGADYASFRGSAERMAALGEGSGNQAALVLGERMLAQAAHFLGQHGRARLLAARALAQPGPPAPLRLASPVDGAVSMRIILARALWMQGFGEQASRAADECVELAEREPTPISLAQALCLAACPLALWRGDHALAREQQAPAWALRCAISLARLRCAQGRAAEGLAPLQALADGFTEDPDSADQRAARALLDSARAVSG